MSSSEISTHETLLARLSDGNDPAAWTEFFERYEGLIRGFARRQGLAETDCDDVVQEVLAALTKSMPQFRYDPVKGKFRSYLKTVALHAVYRISRQKQGVVGLEEIGGQAAAEAADPAVEDRWEAEWRRYHLRRAMRTIEAEFSEQNRAAFDAYALEGKDARQTAEALTMSVEQVYQSKSRILARLSELIEQQIQEEG